MSEFLPEILALTALISGLAACLAWLAKLRWSKEYRETTNRVIEAKDAQIAAVERELQAHRTLTPKTLREYYDDAVYILEKKIGDLQDQVAGGKEEAEKGQKEIASLKDDLQKASMGFTVIASIQHAALPEALVERIKNFHAVLAEVEPTPLGETIHGFRRDVHPEREVAVWEKIAASYQAGLARDPAMGFKKKRKLYASLLQASTEDDPILIQLPPKKRR